MQKTVIKFNQISVVTLLKMVCLCAVGKFTFDMPHSGGGQVYLLEYKVPLFDHINNKNILQLNCIQALGTRGQKGKR